QGRHHHFHWPKRPAAQGRQGRRHPESRARRVAGADRPGGRPDRGEGGAYTYLPGGARRAPATLAAPHRARTGPPEAGSEKAGLSMPAALQRALRIVAAVAPALALVFPAHAQLGPVDNNAPINVQSDSGIEWQQNKQIYIARGNAVATRGTGEIHGDTLIAHYREAKGAENNTEIYRVEADGNVTIKRDNRVVVGDHADYDIDQGVGIVRGKALKMTTAADTVTARDT